MMMMARAKGKIAQSVTQELKALRPEIPESRLHQKVMRTGVGCVFALVALAMIFGPLAVILKILLSDGHPSTLEIIALGSSVAAGVLLLFFASTLWLSSDLVRQSAQVTTAFFRGVWRTVKPGKGE